MYSYTKSRFKQVKILMNAIAALAKMEPLATILSTHTVVPAFQVTVVSIVKQISMNAVAALAKMELLVAKE
eukprot:gene17391-biopygen14947